jgi:DNA-binding NarL/FixJ family response regulator
VATEAAGPSETLGSDPLRVMLVDDHDLFRTGLRNLLEEQGLDIVAEASEGAMALRLVREHAPDVVVMDLNMPGMNGIEATREIARLAPLTRVVVLTISDQDGDVMDAILAGACGYLLKDSSIQDLMQGIRAASVGEALISPHIASKVLQLAETRAIGARDGGPPPDRERQGQRRDRAGASHQSQDGEEPHLQHPDEAPDREPDPGRGLRGQARAGLADFRRRALHGRPCEAE